MKRLRLSLLLGATLLVTAIPTAASADDTIPGCFPNWMSDFASNHPVTDTVAVGDMSDANGDGILCYRILEKKHGKTNMVVYTENHNRHEPFEV